MHLSDGHHDQVVRPDEVGGLENYNFPISCARAERYVDTRVEWTTDTLSPKFKFPVLWVLAYGDFTSGEIHKACERSYYRNQFRIASPSASFTRSCSATWRPISSRSTCCIWRATTVGARPRRTTSAHRTTGITSWRKSPGCTAAHLPTSASRFPIRGPRTSTSTASASTSPTVTTFAPTAVFPGTP